MTQSSNLHNDIDRLKKCLDDIENDLKQLEKTQKPDRSQIGLKEKEKFDILLLLEAIEKKFQELKARENVKPLSPAQRQKQEEFNQKNDSYFKVKSSYLNFIDN